MPAWVVGTDANDPGTNLRIETYANPVESIGGTLVMEDGHTARFIPGGGSPVSQVFEIVQGVYSDVDTFEETYHSAYAYDPPEGSVTPAPFVAPVDVGVQAALGQNPPLWVYQLILSGTAVVSDGDSGSMTVSVNALGSLRLLANHESSVGAVQMSELIVPTSLAPILDAYTTTWNFLGDVQAMFIAWNLFGGN